MRIDLEQFLALTVALGTVGAVGSALYVDYRDQQEAAAVAADQAAHDDEPEAEPMVQPAAPAPVVQPAPAPEPEVAPLPDEAPLDSVVETDEDLDDVPAPYVEGWWMNS